MNVDKKRAERESDNKRDETKRQIAKDTKT